MEDNVRYLHFIKERQVNQQCLFQFCDSTTNKYDVHQQTSNGAPMSEGTEHECERYFGEVVCGTVVQITFFTKVDLCELYVATKHKRHHNPNHGQSKLCLTKGTFRLILHEI